MMSDDDDPENRIPKEFWSWLSQEETSRLIRTGFLDAGMCAKLGLLIGRNLKPPLAVFVEREGLERWLKNMKH